MAKTPSFKFRGIPRITIPKSDAEFNGADYGLSILNKYMPLVLQKHQLNRRKIDYLHNVTLGEQDIHNKKRLYNKDAKNNNIVSENHAFRQTNFKVAFVTSEKRDYAHKSDSNCKDMIYLDRYLIDVDFYAKDKNIKEWIYQTGVGCSYECHRTDIIKKDIKNGKEFYRYLNKDEGFDIETEAPFEFSDLDPRDNFVVYSSIRGNEPLFCVTLVEVERENNSPSFGGYDYKIYIETRYARFIAKCSSNFNGFEKLVFELPKAFPSMPMVEHSINNARLGIVELNLDLFNCLNSLVSNVLDMVVDGANIIMVFKNTDIDQKTIDAMNAKGALILNDNPENKNNSEAKLETVTIKIDFAGLNSFYEERLTQAYDIAGVPLASGQVTSGGDTGQARLLGGGWNNAYTVIKNDITTLLKGDYDVLRLALKICKDVPGCPVKNITASQIDIKYHINQSDNLLTKAQSISTLYGINMPKEEILKVSGLFSDVCAVSQKWEKEDKDAKQKNNETNATDISVATKVDALNNSKGKEEPSKNKQDNSSKE